MQERNQEEEWTLFVSKKNKEILPVIIMHEIIIWGWAINILKNNCTISTWCFEPNHQ